MSELRVSRRRLGQMARELDACDRELVESLAAVKIASGKQLERLHWPTADEARKRAARRRLARLTEWRVIGRLERRVGGLGRGSDSYTYALDVAGQRLVRGGSGRAPHLPRQAMWRHALEGAEVYTRLIEAMRDSGQRLALWQGEPASWRRSSGEIGGVQLLKPDAFAVIKGAGYSDLFFIEIDTGSQSRTVIAEKLKAYVAYAATGSEQVQQKGVFPQVAFLTTEPERVEVLQEVIGRQLSIPARAMFVVGTVEECAKVIVLAPPS